MNRGNSSPSLLVKNTSSRSNGSNNKLRGKGVSSGRAKISHGVLITSSNQSDNSSSNGGGGGSRSKSRTRSYSESACDDDVSSYRSGGEHQLNLAASSSSQYQSGRNGERDRRRSGVAGVDGSSRRRSSDQKDKVPIHVPIPIDCLKTLFYHIVGRYLFESDSFVELMRKFATVPLLATALAASGPAAYWMYMFTQQGFLSDLFNSLSIFLMTPGFLVGYFHMRTTNGDHAPVWIWGVYYFLLMLVLTSLHFGASTTFPNLFAEFGITVMAFILALPKMWIVVSWFVLMVFTECYNEAYREVPGAFVLELPTRDTRGLETLVIYLAVSVPCFMSIVAQYFSCQEQQRQVGAAKKSVEIAQAIVYELRKYNTDKVQEIVDSTLEGDDQDVNKELLVSFGAMVDNLEKYRPFLPNYLFLISSGEEDEDEDDEGTVDDTATEVQSRASSRGSRRGGGRRHHPMESDDEGSVASYSSHSTATTAMNQSGMLSGAVASHSNGSQNLTTTFRGVMTMALIDVQSNAWFSANLRGGCSKATAQSNTLRFSEAVFEAARVSKASVHSMVGDTIQLSWNATHRVAQPETKAAQLLLQLQRSVQEQTGFRIAGAACSGVAETHSVFSQKAKQFALHVDAAWLPALQQLFALACEHRTVLVDSNTKDPASYNVLAQAVDCVRYMPRVARGPVEGGLVSGVEDSALCTVPVGAKSMPGLKPLPFVCGGTGAADDTSKTQQQQPQQSYAVDLASKSYARLMTSAILCNSTVGGDAVHQEPLIAPANSDAWRYTLVYELTSVLQHEEDEWMYQLKAQEAGGGDGGEEKVEEAISAVLHLSLEGRYGEALEYAEQQINSRKRLLSTTTKSSTSDPSLSSLYSRLVTALQAAVLLDSSGGIATSCTNVAVSQK